MSEYQIIAVMNRMQDDYNVYNPITKRILMEGLIDIDFIDALYETEEKTLNEIDRLVYQTILSGSVYLRSLEMNDMYIHDSTLDHEIEFRINKINTFIDEMKQYIKPLGYPIHFQSHLIGYFMKALMNWYDGIWPFQDSFGYERNELILKYLVPSKIHHDLGFYSLSVLLEYLHRYEDGARIIMDIEDIFMSHKNDDDFVCLNSYCNGFSSEHFKTRHVD